MTIEKMRYFVAAAECLSFSQAAQQHYISQAALSQQISSLEKELDTKLFVRSHVQISLTAEGKIFYKECKIILQHYNYALDQLLIYQRERRQVITVGYSSMLEKDLLSQAMRNAGEEKVAKLQFVCQPVAELKRALQDGRLDIVLTVDMEFPGNIQKQIIYSGEFLLGVNLSSPLAKQVSIEGAALANEDIILFAEDAEGNTVKSMLRHCQEDGYQPRVVETVTSMESMVLSVELGRGVAFFPNSPQYLYNDEIHFLRITNTHHRLEVCAAWREDNKSSYLDSLIKNLQQGRL